MQLALYARVSTDRQADKGLSIPDQISSMESWAKANGHTVLTTYVDAGASARTDARPQFQRMIEDASLKPKPFDAIVVHSLSRFFRDHVQLGLYAQSLARLGVELVTITQPTGNDSTGELIRGFFALVDEYQSKENAKHTLRSMQENARQGYWNGSMPPYGYRTTEENAVGRRGKKKKLAVDEAEASIVRKIFDLYLHGASGSGMSVLLVAQYLNEHGYERRGRRWSKGAVGHVLANSIYDGEHWFNKSCARTRATKPKEEWIRLSVPRIVDADIFAAARFRCDQRTPSKSSPGRIGSKTLLTGLIYCGDCGSQMTLSTGKGGRYRYYKCTNRINNGPKSCDRKNIRVEQADAAVLQILANEVCAPKRIKTILAALKRSLKTHKSDLAGQIPLLEREMRDVESRQQRLIDAIETGDMPSGDQLRARLTKLDKKRHQLIIDIAGLRRRGELPVHKLTPKIVKQFSAVLRERLGDSQSAFTRCYVHTLVDRIRVSGRNLHIRGSNLRMAEAVAASQTKPGHAVVPRFGGVWLPDPDSNQGPID